MKAEIASRELMCNTHRRLNWQIVFDFYSGRELDSPNWGEIR